MINVFSIDNPEAREAMNRETAEWERNQHVANLPVVSQQPVIQVLPPSTPIPMDAQWDDVQVFETDNGKYIFEDIWDCNISTNEHREQLSIVNGQINGSVLRRCKRNIVAHFLFTDVYRIKLREGFSDQYIISLKIVTHSEQIPLVISQREYENKRIVHRLRELALAEKIVCGDAEANTMLSRYISKKLQEGTDFYPYKPGFYDDTNNSIMFISVDSAPNKQSDALKNKTFSTEVHISRKEVLAALAVYAEGSYQFLLALSIHYMAMMTSVLRWHNLRFSRMIVVDSDYDTIREFLDVYGNLECNTLIKPGEAITQLKTRMFNTRDDVLYMGEQDHSYKLTVREMNRARENAELLVNTFCKGQLFDVKPGIASASAECLCVIIKGYMSEMLDRNRVFSLSLPEIRLHTGELRELVHHADVYFIKWLRENYSLITEKMKRCRENIKNCTNNDFCSGNDGIILVTVYQIMTDFFQFESQLSKGISEFRSYVNSFMDITESSKEQFAVVQVRKILNDLIINRKIELLHADKIFCTRRLTHAPEVYYMGEYLYFNPELFDEKISDKIGGVTSRVALKKRLRNAGVLKSSTEEELTCKTTLLGVDSQRRYTAISRSILNDEARDLLPSKHATFLQCKDGNHSRILLGYDEYGREVYLSIYHPGMTNKNILVVGSSGSGKTSFTSSYVKGAAKAGGNIVIIDYNHSFSREELHKFGIPDDWIENNIRYIMHTNWVPSIYNRVLGNMHSPDSPERHKKRIVVIQIEDDRSSELEDEEKASETDKILESILNWCKEWHEKKKECEEASEMQDARIHVVIDEVNIANLGRKSLIHKILTQRRKLGLSLMLITPDIKELKLDERDTLMKPATKVVFAPDDASACTLLAKNMNCRSESVLAKHLNQLEKYNCCISGKLEDRKGEMHNELIQVTMDLGWS